MLELKNIKKDYPAGGGVVHALSGIDLQFRESEFVAILGPSGCGKTTMLNIIGGLDQYTEGDLIINGRSTKEFKDRDWDAYRNHSIGFVFQSYNLIPHQSVLQNVELALTLSGVSKHQRRKRAIAALEAVGLGDQLRKKPAQMSGGQMQRVAIARALVNDPDIILADEPTGALDSETSVQVMEILKEVAKDRLVIMVTHNPDLADTYATRTIRMLDGKLTSDSQPLSPEELEERRAADRAKAKAAKKERKPSMRWATSFGLSLKNLIAKGGRTALTSFAGSIGIIGIALIYAVSQGMTTYINTVQEDTLSSYPLTIEATTVDLGSLMTAFLETAKSEKEHEKDGVYSKPLVYDLINTLNSMETTENDLVSFKAYIEETARDAEEPLHAALSGIQYTYDLNMLIYTKNVDGNIIESDAQKLLQEMMGQYLGMDLAPMMEQSTSSPMMSMMTASSPMGAYTLWQEMLPGENGKLVNPLLEKQYDLIYGSWPTEHNEIVLVVDENNELDDVTLYALGLKSEEDMNKIMDAAVNGTQLEAETKSWTFQEICDMDFRTVLPGDCYTLDASTGLYTDLRETDAGMRYLYDKGIGLKVSGIIRPSEDAVSAMLSGSIGYTSKLTEYIIENSRQSDVVAAQTESPEVDVLTGLPFKSNIGSMTAEEKEEEFRAYVAQLDQQGMADAYVKIMSIPSQEQLDTSVAQAMGNMTREDMENSLIQATIQQTGMDEGEITDYIRAMTDEELNELIAQGVAQQVKAQYAAQVAQQMSMMTTEQLAGALTMALEGYTTEQCAQYYDEILTFSEVTYEDNLVALGCLDLDDPATINLYASSFENKDVIEEAIAAYNEGVDEVKQIQYTDYVGIMMSSVTTIIDAITYVLIAFVAISLIVSSIMIGVITLISVQERTKEIGILRAIGASKRNVSSMFNAETVMIGAASGIVGVGLTYLLCIPVNAIIHALTKIPNLSAYLPWQTAVILVGISILLSVFAGLIPSRSAAKKDPVVALRTE